MPSTRAGSAGAGKRFSSGPRSQAPTGSTVTNSASAVASPTSRMPQRRQPTSRAMNPAHSSASSTLLGLAIHQNSFERKKLMRRGG